MHTDISTTESFPKTLVIRNTPKGMIWQVYHVKNQREADKLAENAKGNGFYGITLEDHQPNLDETWPGWRVNAEPEIIGEDYVLTDQDREDYHISLDNKSQEDDDYN